MTRLFLSLYAIVLIGLLSIGYLGEKIWQSVSRDTSHDIYADMSLNTDTQYHFNITLSLIQLLPDALELAISNKSTSSDADTNADANIASILQNWSNKINVPIQLLNTDQISFLQQLAPLENRHNNKPIVTYNAQNQILIYQPWSSQQKMLLIGPFRSAAVIGQSEVRNANQGTNQINNQSTNQSANQSTAQITEQTAKKTAPNPLYTSFISVENIIKLFSYLLLAMVIAAWTWPLWRDLRKLQTGASAFAKGQFDYDLHVSAGSPIKPLANRFQSMAIQIADLIETQKLLANSVSHDLRTPIARIKFSLAMLPPQTQAQLPAIKQDIAALETLVDALLNYARLEQAIHSLNIETVNIGQLMDNLVEANQASTSVNIIYQANQSFIWQCDGFLLERAIQNILNNAIKYAKHMIKIKVYQTDTQLYIQIEDDGIGIDEAQHQAIFKPFSRVDDRVQAATHQDQEPIQTRTHKAMHSGAHLTKKTATEPKATTEAESETETKSNATNKQANHSVEHFKGFGLGLAIVQKICQWHNGQCHVRQSQLGGAAFLIELPVAKRKRNI